MIDYIRIIIAFLITFPMVPTLLVYTIGKKFVRHQWRAIHLAIHWTTILYIFSTMAMLNMMFEQQFIGIISGFILLMLTIIIIWQWKTKTEILMRRALKLLWRLCFLIFSFTYCLLIIYGIIIRIIF